MKNKKAIHHAEMYEWIDGLCKKVIRDREVIVMATSGNYAMVRRPKCAPYVAPLREIEFNKPQP